MPELPQDTRRHLAFAHAYFELGMDDAAEREWKQITPLLKDSRSVLAFGVELARRRSRWGAMLQRSKRFRKLHPDAAEGWLLLSYAARRAQSLDEAYNVLSAALAEHPSDALVHFNLGCYACLLGRHKEATERVCRAVLLDNKLAAAALEDPDLEAIRKDLKALSKPT